MSEVIRIGREVADGLAAAHERGLIHRDIKPGNIWLETSRGRPRVKILDFGLAHVADADIDLTQSTAILGTPSYMAPEQARGEAVDARADLFSLGCVLYRMTTGEPPFKGTSPIGVLMALGTTTPPAPRELNSDIPADLNDLIVALLSKDPAGRPASAREVMERLDSVGDGLRAVPPASATALAEDGPPGPSCQESDFLADTAAEEEIANCKMQIANCKSVDGPATNPKSQIQNPKSAPPPPPRRRTFIALAAAAAAAALLAGVVITIKDREGNVVATVETNDAAKVKVSPEYNAEVAPSDEAEGPKSREQSPKSKVQSPKSEVAGTDRRPSETAAADNIPPAGFHALFNGNDLTGWKGVPNPPFDNPIERAKAARGDLAAAQAAADHEMNKHWSAKDGVLVFDGSGPSLATAKEYSNFELLIDWKIEPGGDSGIYLRGAPQVQIWDPASEAARGVGSGGLYNNQRYPSQPAALADNPLGEWNTLKITMWGERVTVKLNGVLVVDHVVLENFWNRGARIFPTGQIELQNHTGPLYFKNIYVRELAAAAPLAKTQDLSPKTASLNPKSEIQNLKSLSPMALVTEPTLIEGVKSWTVETISPRGRIYQAEFSPDGALAATLGIDATLRLWNPATGKLVRALVGASAGQHAFAWSPDGKQMAVAENSRVLLWETETGKRLKSFEIERAAQVFNATFSPDGGTLAVLLLRGIGDKPDTVELYAVERGELLDAHRTFGGWYPWMHGSTSTPGALLTWSPDGKQLTIGNEIWDTAASASRDAGGGVTIDWRDDGVLIKALPVRQGDQAAIELWRVDTNERLHTLSGEKEAIRFRAFSPGGKFLLATSARVDNGDEEARAYVFDTASGTLAYKRELLPDGEGYTEYALSPDGKSVLAFGPLAGNLWSVAAAAAEDGPPGPSSKTEDGPPDSSSRSRDGLGRPSSAKPNWKLPSLLGHGTTFLSAWSPDGATLAVRGGDDALSLWQLHSGQPRVTRNVPGYSLDWSSDGERIRAWGREEYVAYDPATGQQRHWDRFANRDGWLYASLDGSRVAAVGQKEVTIFAVDTGEALRTLPPESKYSPTWSLDPNRLITVGEKTTLWNLETGEALKTIDASAPADWSPDGRKIAYCYEDGRRLEIRDVENGERVVTLENDPPLIVPRVRLTWSPDSTWLAGLGRVWDAQSGKMLSSLPRYPSSWLARAWLSADRDPNRFDFRARWSPDGAYLTYLAADRSVPVVEAASGRVVTTLLSFSHDRTMAVSPSGHFRCSPRFESELVYIVETDAGQETLSPREFAEKYGWRNDPRQVGIKQGGDDQRVPGGQNSEELANANLSLPPGEGGAIQVASRDKGETKSGATLPHPIPAEEGITKPLGSLALVQRPAALPGVESWSLEPVLLAGAFHCEEQAQSLSPHGKLLAVGGEEGHVRIYDVFNGNTPRLSKLLIGHASRVVAVEFSPDGRWIASAEANRPNVRIWETATGKLFSSTFLDLGSWEFPYHLAFSPDSATLAVGNDGDDHPGCILLDAASGEVVRRLGAPGFYRASSFSWSSDGAKLAVVDWDRVFIFDVASGAAEGAAMRHPDGDGFYRPNSVAWSPDCDSIAFGANNHSTIVWSTADGSIRAKLPVKADGYQRPVLRWMDHGTRIGLNTDGQWQEWDVNKGMKVDGVSSTPRLAHSADGTVVAAQGSNGGNLFGIDIVDTRTKKRRTLAFRGSIDHLAWSADGRTLATATSFPANHPIVWTLDGASNSSLECLPQAAGNGTVVFAWLPESGSLFDAHVRTHVAIWSRGKQGWQPKMLGIAMEAPAAVSSDRKQMACIAAPSDRKTVTIYDLVTGAKLREIGPHAAGLTAVAWSPESAHLVTGTEAGDLAIWDAQTGERLHSARPFPGFFHTVAWSPDGQTVSAAYHGGRIYLCNRELSVVRELPRHDAPRGFAAATWSSDGTAIDTIDDCLVRRWDASTGKKLTSVNHHIPHVGVFSPAHCEFSPAFTRIAATGAACRIVDAGSGEQQAAIVPLLGGKAVVVSADGHYLESGLKAADQLVYVVQTAAGQELLSIKEFTEKYGWKNDPNKVTLPE